MNIHDWKATASTNIGTVRKVNEDDFLNGSSVGIWCVADGMGGHQKGDVASRMIVDALAKLNVSRRFPLSTEQIKAVIVKVNAELIALGKALPESAVIGSTVAVLSMDSSHAHCLWAGDSRIYRMRDQTLSLLTKDHSQIEEMIDAGLLTADEAEGHPSSNVITRAVGASKNLKLDVLSYPRQRGDVYMLCSDGLNKVLSHDEIANLITANGVQNSPQALIQRALKMGARDNITVVAVLDTYQQAQPYPSAGGTSHPQLDDTLPLNQ